MCSECYNKKVTMTAKKPKMSKDTLLPLLAGHVLAHGMGGASLRPMAKSAGTSDRMLLYHFGSKEQLLAELLQFLADAYSAALDTNFRTEPVRDRHDCIKRISDHMAQPATAPFMALWWEIVAGCARGQKGYQDAASAMMDRLLEWLVDHMPADDPDPQAGARYVLTVIEGAQMLKTIGLSLIHI